MMIGLLNYGAGNYGSVRNALDHLGLPQLEVQSAEAMDRATHLILPGVGAFPDAMRRLREMDLIEPLRKNVLDERKPFLGICVGMQLLAETGFEFEQTDGLGWIDGEVRQLDVAEQGLAVPHIGWNEITFEGSPVLLRNLSPRPTFYFVHSYAFRCRDAVNELARCDYGTPVTAVVERDNIFGVQFHPEKSQRDGLQLLKNFSAL